MCCGRKLKARARALARESAADRLVRPIGPTASQPDMLQERQHASHELTS